MQLPGPGVFGPPRDHDQALAVLRRTIELGINHIDTAQFYGPDVANELIREALHPYPAHLALVSKVGGKRDDQGNWLPPSSPTNFGATSRTTCARWRPTGSPPSTCACSAGPRPQRPGRGGPRAVRPPAVHDDQGPRRRTDRRHRAEQHQPSSICRLRSTAPRSSACRTHTTLSTERHNRCSTPASNTASRSSRSSRSARVSPPTIRCSATPPFSARRPNSGAPRRRSRLRGRLSVAPNVLLIPGTSSVPHLEENTAVADIELDDDAKLAARRRGLTRNQSTSTQSSVRCTAFCQPA